MAGAAIGPDLADGDLTGDVVFNMGSGCGEFDYGYTSTTASPPPPPPNEAPTSQAAATPKSGNKARFNAERGAPERD